MQKFFLLFFFTFQIISIAQITDASVEKARIFLYNNETHHKPAFIDSVSHDIKEMSYEMAKEYYVFNGEVSTPLTKTKFLQFSINSMNPTPSFIVVCYNDTLELLIEWSCYEGYACNKLLTFLNERLEAENKLDEYQIVELAHSLIKISSPTWDFYKIISNYYDVSWRGENNTIMHLPDTLKEQIKPMLIKQENNIIELEYYMWDEVILKKINLYYLNRKLDVKIKPIWNSGRRFMVG